MTAPAYRIDGAPAGESAFYAVACDPRQSCVVEACAGAGKTWMLVSRIVRALLAGAEPGAILAITFTRRAAGEMRQRLDDWLATFAAPGCDDAERIEALRQRGVPAADAARLAPQLAALHARLLDGGRAVEIRTFHGWFAQLLSQAPLQLLDELGLPPRAELLEDPAPLRAELLRRFHRTVDADPALRAVYLSLVADHRRATLLQWLLRAWERSTEIEAAAAAGTLAGAIPPAVALFPECAGLNDPRELLLRNAALRADVAALARCLAAGGAKARDAADKLRAALDETDAKAAYRHAWSALHTEQDQPRKQLGEDTGCAALAERLRHLQSMVDQHDAHRDQRRMAVLSQALLAEYAALKRRRGIADMADLERAALALLSEPQLAGHVQQRLDQRLAHVLIDEFQDTSPLQWQALHGWLSSYAGAGGGGAPSVFIVGDPKQSIYRFRRAEPRVFDAARRFVVAGLGGRVLACDHTRRNAPAIVGALNAVFADAARLDGWKPFRAHTTASAAPGAVRALPGVLRPPAVRRGVARADWRDSLTEPRAEPETRLRRQEAAHVADAVATLVADHGLRCGEVMVLARRRALLHLVADALAERRLPYAAPESMNLAAAPEALDLAALLDVLASPGHDLALARALKSPLFGATDADLLWLHRAARDGERPWLAALLAAAAPPGAALSRARGLLERWSRAVDQLPPHDLLDRIVDEGELLPRLAAVVPPARLAAAVQAVQSLLAAALQHDGGRYAGAYRFVRALKAGLLQATPAAVADAVQLLTVHGAKGLEARAVVVVDADPEIRHPERATLLVDWPVDAAAPRCAAFVAREARVPPSLQPLFATELAAREREEINGLYVAATRAREWLVFSHTDPYIRPRDRTWWQRVQPHAADWSPPAATVAEQAAAASTLPLVDVLPALTRARPAAAASTTLDAGAARLGQAVHRALEWLGQPGAANGSDAWQPAAAAAAAAFGADAGAVLMVVANVLSDAASARFFVSPALRWAGNEVPLADAAGSLRIDRLVLLGDTWWVLDYKLHRTPAELPVHREQLARYVAAVRAAQPGAPVRGGFIGGNGVFFDVSVDG